MADHLTPKILRCLLLTSATAERLGHLPHQVTCYCASQNWSCQRLSYSRNRLYNHSSMLRVMVKSNSTDSTPYSRAKTTELGHVLKFALATAAYIPRLGHIHMLALARESAARLKFSYDPEFQDEVELMLQSQISDSTWLIVKVTSRQDQSSSGNRLICSWAGWQLH